MNGCCLHPYGHDGADLACCCCDLNEACAKADPEHASWWAMVNAEAEREGYLLDRNGERIDGPYSCECDLDQPCNSPICVMGAEVHGHINWSLSGLSAPRGFVMPEWKKASA